MVILCWAETCGKVSGKPLALKGCTSLRSKPNARSIRRLLLQRRENGEIWTLVRTEAKSAQAHTVCSSEADFARSTSMAMINGNASNGEEGMDRSSSGTMQEKIPSPDIKLHLDDKKPTGSSTKKITIGEDKNVVSTGGLGKRQEKKKVRATPSRRKPGETRGRPRKYPVLMQPEIEGTVVYQGETDNDKKRSMEEDAHTELIVKLERRGDGWGEEIIPSITVERRLIEPLSSVRQRAMAEKSRIASATNVEVSEAGVASQISIEENDGFAYLIKVGVLEEEVQDIVVCATSWRVTPEGRALIDRRRQSRLARNVRVVAEHLRDECGIPFGIDGVGAVFRQCPDLMLCKPTSNDRWDRRAVELAAFKWRYGHCNVPEEWPQNPELSIWVARQRVARASGQLTSERVQVLQRLGFEFGDLAQITDEWEHRFDQLVDWMLWHGENNQSFSWVGIDWGERGGVTAREVALWMSLQREFRRRRLLPEEAEQRFAAIGVQWDITHGRTPEFIWMEWFGRLLYVVEKRCSDRRGIQVKPKFGRSSFRPGRKPIHRSDTGVVEEESVGQKVTYGTRDGKRDSQRSRLDIEAAERREVLAAGPIKEDPGLSFWLCRQRWLWRQGRLTMEQVRMLHLAGVDMDAYSPTEWQVAAHTAAAVLKGSKITLGITHQTDEPNSDTGMSANTCKYNPVLPRGVPLGILKLRVRRWLQTQRALFGDSRLSTAQLRYLSFLGISWVLSDAVCAMHKSEWMRFFEAWNGGSESCDCKSGGKSSFEKECHGLSQARIDEWLEHQKGLHAVGLLPKARAAALIAAGLDWSFIRTPEDDEWDLRLSQLLVHSIETGNLELDPSNEPYEGLASWLKARREEMSDPSLVKLAHNRAMQLRALGIQPAS